MNFSEYLVRNREQCMRELNHAGAKAVTKYIVGRYFDMMIYETMAVEKAAMDKEKEEQAKE